MIRPAVLNCCQLQRIITMFKVSTIILLCLLPQAKSGDCDEHPLGTFNWRGPTTQAIDDCDILRPQMKVRFNWLTNKPGCLREVTVKIYKTGSLSLSQLSLGTPGQKIVEQITNYVAQSDRCKAARVDISAVVHSHGRRQYTTTFILNANVCTTSPDVNFAKDCSGEVEVTEPATVTPNQTGTNHTTGNTCFFFQTI